VTLFSRVVAINVGLLVAAALALALTPATVSARPRLAEAAVLAVGSAVVIAVNVMLLRRVFGPLEQLTAIMGRVDPRAPGRRLALARADPEVDALCGSFNGMLDRLEDERRTSARRALAAQERERSRLARELHDELGQTLTGVVLQLEGLRRSAPDALRPAIEEVQEAVRAGGEDVREISRGLRPHALDEFGLRSALLSLAAQTADHSGIRIRTALAGDVPALPPEVDLAIYRVAQEALTNVARHAGAREVALGLTAGDGLVCLTVGDDGRGITELEAAGRNTGLGGMHERALLVGGTLAVRAHAEGGTEVRLVVPTGSGNWAPH